MQNFSIVYACLQGRWIDGHRKLSLETVSGHESQVRFDPCMRQRSALSPGITTLYTWFITQVPALPPDLRTGSKAWWFQRKLLLPQPFKCLMLSVVILQSNTVVPDHFYVLYSICFLKALSFLVNNPGQVKYGRNAGCDP